MNVRKNTLRKETFITHHRYALFFFVFVILYNYLIIMKAHIPQMEEPLYSLHLVDFSVGFCTKLLPGAIYYGIFGDHSTRTIALVYEMVLLLLFFAGLSFLLEKFLKRVEKENKGAALFLLILYLTGPCTFHFFANTIGTLDVYWVFLSLLFFLCLDSKWARWLIPIICFLMIMVHYAAIVSYILMILIILLFKMSGGAKRRIWILIFLLTLVVSVGTVVYFLKYESGNLTMTMDEFDRFMESRGCEDSYYFNYSLYENAGDGFVDYHLDVSSNFILGLLKNIVDRIHLNRQYLSGIEMEFFMTLFNGMMLLSPFLYFTYKVIMKRVIDLKGDYLKRIVYMSLMIQFWVTLFIPILVSADSGRWGNHSFLVFFTTLLYLMYSDQELKIAVFERIRSVAKQPLLYFWVYAYQFALLVFLD